jgi:hypothetical protein
MGHGLSQEQKGILHFLGSKLTETRERLAELQAQAAEKPDQDLDWLIKFHGWILDRGIRWNRTRNHNRSQSASLSRALKRLEGRGLVIRRDQYAWRYPDWPDGMRIGRTMCVQLTAAGWDAFQRLNTES